MKHQNKTLKEGLRVLIVDDDDDLRQSVAEGLELHEKFLVTTAATGADGLQVARQERFDCIILDVGLPDMDGRDLCRALRRHEITVPIVMLTGHTSDADTVLGLNSGANDYVTKPFKMNVLLARIRAHLQHYESSEDAIFDIGPFVFKPSAKQLVSNANGKRLRLTDKETSILKYLYRSKGEVVSRATLLDEVWGYGGGITTHTLETHIYRLRQKIEENPAQAVLLVTENGGYRLNP